MFFILSKVLDFLLSPLIWIMLILLAGVIVRTPGLRKRFIYSGIILFFLFSNPFLASEVFRAWEGEPQTLSSVGHYDVGLVLTGVAFSRSSAPDRVFFSKGADRVVHAVQLYRAAKIKKILITGGSGLLSKKELSESSRLKTVMLYCGIPDSAIYLEEKSRNTRESARFTKQVIDAMSPEARMLLVTSAFHIPRSLGCFRKAGMIVDGYGVDYHTEDRSFELHDLVPSASALNLWEILIHEITGYGVYKVMGYL